MKAIVIYDSFFGNTEKIAQAVGQAIGQAISQALADGGVEVLPVSQASPERLLGVQLLVVGSPTRGFQPSEKTKLFLKDLAPKALAGAGVAAFDTRIALETIESSALRFIVKTGGYAAKTIAAGLQKRGGRLIAPPEGFLVTGEQGPLQEGELERAAAWARGLVGLSNG